MNNELLISAGLMMIAAGLMQREGRPPVVGTAGVPTTRQPLSPSNENIFSGLVDLLRFDVEPVKVASVSRDVDILARTLWGEARGEHREGREAVASVIMARVDDRRYPNTPAGVCQQPWQFSVWNPGDPNREKVLAVTVADRIFKECLAIAQRAVSGSLVDKTGGATHYHTNGVRPNWADDRKISATIGSHIFYRGIA